jgi:signal transduction histidine kinase
MSSNIRHAMRSSFASSCGRRKSRLAAKSRCTSVAVEVAAYRIAQEALTNVLRHANGQHCTLRMQMEDSALCLEIADDGQGLPAQYRAGVGLRAMAERAEELGGRCSITQGPTGGTVVRARLPVAQEPIPQPITAASVEER